MLRTLHSISSLLLGIGVLLVGVGLLGTLLGVRAGLAGFGDAVTGAVMSAYFVGYIIGTLACPALIRRVGHIRAFAAMAAVASAAAIAHAIWVDALAWAALRVVTGASLVGLYMVVESWLNVLAPKERRGQVFAIYMMVSLIALAAGQFLLLVGNAADFVPFALVSILLSFGLVPVALTRVSEPHPVETPRLGLRRLYAISPLAMVGALASGLVLGAFWGMGAVFAHGVNVSPAGIATFMGATILGGALLQWPMGRWSDRHDRRTVLAAVSFAAAVLAVGLYLSVTWWPTALYVCAFVFGGFAFTVYGLSVAHLHDHLGAAEALEATSGLLLVYGTGAAFGPLLSGALMSAFGAAILPAYFAVVLGGLGAYALRRMDAGAPMSTAQQGEFVAVMRTSQAALELDPRVEPGADVVGSAATCQASTRA